MGHDNLEKTAKHHAMRAVVLTWILGFAMAMFAMMTAWKFTGIRGLPLVTKVVIAAVGSALFQALSLIHI